MATDAKADAHDEGAPASPPRVRRSDEEVTAISTVLTARELAKLQQEPEFHALMLANAQRSHARWWAVVAVVGSLLGYVAGPWLEAIYATAPVSPLWVIQPVEWAFLFFALVFAAAELFTLSRVVYDATTGAPVVTSVRPLCSHPRGGIFLFIAAGHGARYLLDGGDPNRLFEAACAVFAWDGAATATLLFVASWPLLRASSALFERRRVGALAHMSVAVLGVAAALSAVLLLWAVWSTLALFLLQFASLLPLLELKGAAIELLVFWTIRFWTAHDRF